MRSGVLLQNLGSLLLELGHATMMLRINPTSLEAYVNSGPALFISPSGPNPLIVQPVPFFPGRSVQMGTVFSSLGSQGSVLHPRDVDVHIHTSNLAPPIDINVGNSSETTPGQHSGLSPLFQILNNLRTLFSGENGRANGISQQAPMSSAEQEDAGNSGRPEVSGVSGDGLRFANIVRQIMPFISQAETRHQSAAPDSSSTPSQAASDSSNGARDGPSDSRSSHQHNRDRTEEPNSKRQRTSD